MKKTLILLSLFAFPLAYSQEKKSDNEKLNLDILGSIGFSNYRNYPALNSLNDYFKSIGVNVDGSESTAPYYGVNAGASALYSFYKTSIGYPVVGAGLNYVYATTDESKNKYYTDGYTSNSKTGNTSSLFIDLYAGFNFTFIEQLKIFTLFNYGYSIYDKASQTENFNIYLNSGITVKSSLNNSYTVKNHQKYGFTGICLYELTNEIGIGAGLDINSHSFSASGTSTYATGFTQNINQNSTFTEVSARFIMSYSL